MGKFCFLAVFLSSHSCVVSRYFLLKNRNVHSLEQIFCIPYVRWIISLRLQCLCFFVTYLYIGSVFLGALTLGSNAYRIHTNSGPFSITRPPLKKSNRTPI